MKSPFRALALGFLLLLPAAAWAQAPVITSISDLSLNAGGTATIAVVAVDPNGDAITLTSSLPAFATLNSPTTGTGLVATTITLMPASGTTGTFTGSVTATAGGETDVEEFQVTVNASGTNLAPTVTAPAVWTLVEGQTINLVVTASDANGDAITSLTATGLPSGATFTSNASHTSGTLTWTPTTSQAGAYDVTFTAANALTGSASTHFVVLESGQGNNNCPTITAPTSITVNEGTAVNLSVVVADADNNNTTITASNLPTGATFTDNNNNTGTFTWTPSNTQSGTFVVTFAVNDNAGCVQMVTTVINVSETAANPCPVITLSQSTLTVTEGQHFAFNVTVSDPDGGNVDLMASNLPTGATFVDHDNNTGTLEWTPSSTQAGTYLVVFAANDNEGCTPTATLTVTVNEGTGNQCPTITAPTTQTVVEGQALNFTVTASDPDGGGVTLSATGVPSGATFTTSSGAFSWTPNTSQAGTYTVTFSADDGEGCVQTATTVITVTEQGGNQCPTISAPATRSVNEGQSVTFTVTASDPDGGGVTLSATGVPSGATFTTSSGAFSWTPNTSQAGTYTVTFSADDGEGCVQTATTVITVIDVGGGGQGTGTGTLIGNFNTHKKFLCFRIVPTNSSFHLRDVDLSSIMISFNGTTVSALSGKTHLEFECEDDDHDDDGDCDRCDDDDDDAGRFTAHRASAGDDDDCDHDEDDDGEDDENEANCTLTHLRACFSMSQLRDLFGVTDFRSMIATATITGDLTTGGSFVVTLNGNTNGNQGNQGNHGDNGKGKMHAKVRPNPLNPKADLTFTLARGGRVRVTVFDAQGRFVKTLLDENRAAGTHTVTWDGSDSRSGKVSSGVYFFRILATEGKEVVRVTVLK